MPIYEYECARCGEQFSRLRAIREMDEPATCPRCGAAEARRLISRIGAASGPRDCAPAG